MSIETLVNRLTELGIAVQAEDGRLVVKAPKGAVTPDIQDLIVTNKPALLSHLERVGTAEDDRPAPLTHAQEGLLFLSRLDGGGENYNMVAALRIEGGLDAEILRRTLETLVARHQALRIRLHRDGDRVVQSAVPPGRFDLPVMDIAEDRIDAEIRREAEHRFQMEGGPLFQARLLRIGAADHVLLLCLHHVIGDGWSLGILSREISAVYPALAAGRPAGLPPLKVQYLDCIRRKRAALDGGAMERGLAYWSTALDGAPAVLDFGLDRPRPPRRTTAGGTAHTMLDGGVLEALQAHARAEGVTLFMYLLTAFNILAARYSGQTDIVLGSPMANRPDVEMEAVVGFFVDTLVLRNRVDATATFGDLLARVKASTLQAFRHADVPFQQLVEHLRPERSLSYSPVFQVVFGMQDAASPTLSMGDLQVRPVTFTADTTKFDLTVNAAVEDGRLIIAAEYASDLYEPQTVRNILDDYASLLTQLAGRSDPIVGDLPIPRLNERMLAFGRGPASAMPADILSAIEQAVRRSPDAVAVEDGRSRLTYGELADLSGRAATCLAARGAGPGKLIGVAARASVEFLAAVLAVMKTGASYLPLDPSYPDHRLAGILASGAPDLVLVEDAARIPNPIRGRDVLSLADLTAAAKDSACLAPRPVPPQAVAYVIFTSGSTGTPKGVAVPHAGLANLVAHLVPAMGLTREDRVLQFTPTGFDVSVQEIFSTLAAGATLVFPPPDLMKVGDALVRHLADARITVVALPPSVLSTTNPEGLSRLRMVVSGAEAIAPAVVDRWATGRSFFYNYGPTETSVTATATFCRPGQGRPSIGRPLTNVAVHIVDERMRPVPVNAVGEIMIGGVGVAHGYLNAPGMTADRFLPDPFADAPGARLYRTGDLARFKANGDIEFVGRADTQVKLRGFRIELGEVEAAMLAHEAVREAVAVVVEDEEGGRRLVGYARMDDPVPEGAVDALRTHLRRRLPHYMVPAVLVPLTRFPTTPNGKIDKAALPNPATAPTAVGPEDASSPAGRIAAAFAAVIGTPHVGPEENFFEAGGDSMLAVQLATRLSTLFDCQIGIADIFENPTSNGLARWMASREQAELASLLSEVESMSEEEVQRLLSAAGE